MRFVLFIWEKREISLLIYKFPSFLNSSDDLFGWSAAALNDINRDGFHDFAISATGSNIIYVVYGSADLPNKDIDMSSFGFSIGIKIIGSANDINTGLCVSSAGDFNNDSFPDLIFTAIQLAPSYQNVIYLLFGFANQRQRDIRIDHLSAESFIRIVSVPSYFAGLSLAGLGDINSDGDDDIIIGSVPYQGSYREQKSYVIYGRNGSTTTTAVSNTIQLSELREDEGFIITGGGFAVAGVGDVNEDGINDLMVYSYSDWHGKGNAYLMVYPTNISAPPTFLPTSSPSSFPSSQPSSVPTEKKPQTCFPSSLPSFKSQSPSNELLTAPPWVTKTDSPSLAPKTNKPSRSPTFRPTSGSPTVKPSNTHSPTTSKPTRRPTVIPTIVPTPNPTTVVPSRSPSFHPSIATQPTSFPSVLPTQPALGAAPMITLNQTGTYEAIAGKANIVIRGTGNYEITGNSGPKIYTILPAKNKIIITDFNNNKDILNFEEIPNVHSISDLSFTSNPLTFHLSLLSEEGNGQLIVLSSHANFDLKEGNFQFSEKKNDSRYNFEFSISLIVSLAILFTFCGFICLGTSVFSKKDKDEENKKNGMKFEEERDDEKQHQISEETDHDPDVQRKREQSLQTDDSLISDEWHDDEEDEFTFGSSDELELDSDRSHENELEKPEQEPDWVDHEQHFSEETPKENQDNYPTLVENNRSYDIGHNSFNYNDLENAHYPSAPFPDYYAPNDFSSFAINIPNNYHLYGNDYYANSFSNYNYESNHNYYDNTTNNGYNSYAPFYQHHSVSVNNSNPNNNSNYLYSYNNFPNYGPFEDIPPREDQHIIEIEDDRDDNSNNEKDDYPSTENEE
jgi:hypothetical protein